jgi:hypothetical protein
MLTNAALQMHQTIGSISGILSLEHAAIEEPAEEI